MIASRAIAVLPVLRSPMISSRWPRPIGVIASTALMPVCSGSQTGCRSATPGGDHLDRAALVGHDRPLAVERIAQRIDDAAEHLFADRNAQQLAGAADLVPFVDLQRKSPRMITPTRFSSRLNARPIVPPGNSTISLAITPERP